MSSTNNNNKGDTYFDNVADNYFRYIENLKRHPRSELAAVEELDRRGKRTMQKYPQIFMLAFSDNPENLEKAKRLTLERMAQLRENMEYPSS